MNENVIELRSLAKSYPPREPGGKRTELFRTLDLEVARGEFVAVEGQSGTGKSSLLHILGGLDREYAGEVKILGRDLRGLDDRALSALRHAQIGFVFQSFNLLSSLSALENVLLPDFFGEGVSDARARATEALSTVGLSDKASARPTALSGGERQRVAIARALVGRPPLLLADEPTGNLDARTGQGIIDLFQRLHREGMTLLVVTHEKRMSRAASRVLVLERGELAADPALEGSA
jgi:putative ABC transport system ATP-binding protein